MEQWIDKLIGFACGSCKPMATSRTTEAWLATGTNETLSSTSINRYDPSPPPVVRRSQYISGAAAGNTHSDLLEPVLGFSDDSPAAVGIHRPAILKPQQKRKPSRGICCFHDSDWNIIFEMAYL